MLGFRVGSIPVSIHASFFLTAVLLGATTEDLAKLVIWVGVVFVSIFVHESGHALVGRLYGLQPRIALHGMGGTTSFAPSSKRIGWGGSIAIAAAGPFTGFLFIAVVIVAQHRGVFPTGPLAHEAYEQLLWVNIGWGLVNLLPLLPLDGGLILRAGLQAITKGRGDVAARVISIVVASGVFILAVAKGTLWGAFLAIMFAGMNIRAMKVEREARRLAPALEALSAANALLERQEGAEAIEILRPLVAARIPMPPELERLAVRQLAYAFLLEKRWSDLLPHLGQTRSQIGPEEMGRFVVTLRELGEHEIARQVEALIPPPAAPPPAVDAPAG